MTVIKNLGRHNPPPHIPMPGLRYMKPEEGNASAQPSPRSQPQQACQLKTSGAHGSSAPPCQHGRSAPHLPPCASNTTNQPPPPPIQVGIPNATPPRRARRQRRRRRTSIKDRVFTLTKPVQQETEHLNGAPNEESDATRAPPPLPPTNHQ
jgi:hypothetical protein